MKKSATSIAYVFLVLAAIGLLLWVLSLISHTILYVILAVLILLVMVMIHEFGHYLAGKALKFKINEFAIGFGPKLLSFKRKNGEIFSIRLLPLGGFCAFEGEDEIEEQKKEKQNAPKDEPFTEYSKNITIQNSSATYTSDTKSAFVGEPQSEPEQKQDSRSDLKRFTDQEPWKRIVVLVAGGLFNLVSAIFFSFLFILIVGYELPKINHVYEVPSTPGIYYNDLMPDDTIIAINGTKIGIMHPYNELLSSAAKGESVSLTVLRDGNQMEIIVVKQEITIIKDGEETKYDGFGFERKENFANADIGYALKYSVPFTGKLAWSILGAFGGLFTGEVKITDLAGPVGTVESMAEISQTNWRNIFLLLPLIAANLGIFNLFPFPALDGSKVIFCLIEWIRKKPINRNVEAYIHLVGMVVLLLFVIVVDIISFAT